MSKNIFLRTLYDFANSLVMIIFLFYFSQRIVIDQGLSEIRRNWTLIVASIIFILVSPHLSRLVDKGASKIKWLRTFTIASVLLFAIVSLMAMYTPQHVYLIIALYSLAMGIYLICFVFYTPMLRDLATPETYGKISGRGQGVNSFWQIVWILVTIPIVNGAIPMIGSWRVGTFLPATIIFLLFALPMLLRYNASAKAPDMQHESEGVRHSLKQLFNYKVIWLFLLWYLFYSDALLTFSNNFPLYLEKVHGVTDTTKSLLTAVILLGASLSAFFSGKFADKKWLSKCLLYLLWARCIVFPLFSFIKGFWLLTIVSCLAGIIYGPVRSISRALLTKLLPSHLNATGFAYFTIFERFATLLWPLVRGVIVTSMDWSALGYKYALITMAVFVLIGRWITRYVRTHQDTQTNI